MECSHLHGVGYRLRYDDVDGEGLARPATFLELFEDAAASHCEAAGHGIYELLSRGLGWVLLRGSLEVSRYPHYGEEIRVETWASSAKRFRAEREYLVRDRAGEVIAAARSLWLFCDIAQKRPATILPPILEAWTPGGPLAADLPLDEIPGPADESPNLSDAAPFPVRGGEIDSNGHVNNVVYLGWALESVPGEVKEGSRLRRIDGHWKRELTLGATALPRSVPTLAGDLRLGVYGLGGGEGGGVADGEAWLAAAARTWWAPVGEDGRLKAAV